MRSQIKILFWSCILNGGHSREMFAFNQDLLFKKVIKLRVTVSSLVDWRKLWVFQNVLDRLLDSAAPFQFSLDKNLFCFEYVEINKTFSWL